MKGPEVFGMFAGVVAIWWLTYCWLQRVRARNHFPPLHSPPSVVRLVRDDSQFIDCEEEGWV